MTAGYRARRVRKTAAAAIPARELLTRICRETFESSAAAGLARAQKPAEAWPGALGRAYTSAGESGTVWWPGCP